MRWLASCLLNNMSSTQLFLFFRLVNFVITTQDKRDTISNGAFTLSAYDDFVRLTNSTQQTSSSGTCDGLHELTGDALLTFQGMLAAQHPTVLPLLEILSSVNKEPALDERTIAVESINQSISLEYISSTSFLAARLHRSSSVADDVVTRLRERLKTCLDFALTAKIATSALWIDVCANSTATSIFANRHNCSHSEQCTATRAFSLSAFHCTCPNPTSPCASVYALHRSPLARLLLIVNVLAALASTVLIFVVAGQRRTHEISARGWALMEICLFGAVLLYSSIVAEFVSPSRFVCRVAPWFRSLGFICFYGALILKIYRNLIEYRVRRAHHVQVREKDLLKRLGLLLYFTATGLIAFTVTSAHYDHTRGHEDSLMVAWSRHEPPHEHWRICRPPWWTLMWHVCEIIILSYGLYLSYKARHTQWAEKRSFGIALALELCISIVFQITKFNAWNLVRPDYMLLLSCIHIHMTVTPALLLVLVPKLRHGGTGQSRTASSHYGPGGNKAHPSLAKLRDDVANGTIDVAQIPIGEMDPDEIRAELKRVYGQLQILNLQYVCDENPHIGKRKGKKVGEAASKTGRGNNRRMSLPYPNKGAPNAQKCDDETTSMVKNSEPDEVSSNGSSAGVIGSPADFTITSSPHNVYVSACTTPGADIVTTRIERQRLVFDANTACRV